jgi:hypothetical protein
MAITSLVLGCASFMCYIFTGLPAVILGVLALRKINRSGGQLKGDGLAIGGIVTGGVSTFLMLPIMVALLLPAVQAAREAARRNMSMNNMKQIVLALLNYHDQHKVFPAAGGGDVPGTQLSWRVRILPLLDQQALYEQFHLDEPWDSEHNRALVERMPDIYKSPNEILPPGETPYQAVTGPNTAFENPSVGRRIREFSDGTSNTIMVVEADQGVIWTKPEDWELDPANPFRGLGKTRPFGFLAVFADGHAASIDNTADPATVKALMTCNGGEVVAP